MSRPVADPSRVLHLIPTLFDGEGQLLGGAERYALELARHMAEWVPTRLVSFGPVAREVEVDRLKVRIYAGAHHVRGQPGNPLHPALLGEIRKAAVVHCHQTHVLMSSAAALLGRLTGRPVFTTDLGGGGWDISAYLPTDNWFKGHLHISEYSRRFYGHQGNPRARVILGGVDVGKFVPPEAPLRRSTVLFVGRLLPHKGVDDLIRAMPYDLRLTVAGRPQDAAYLDQLRELARGRPVAFELNPDDQAMIRLYQEALCVVLPSVYVDSSGARTAVPELLGQTLLEGMACGAPVICTDVASMPEVVENGVCGFVVPPNDPAQLRSAIQRLSGDPALTDRMGEAGRRRVMTMFTWDAVVERCLEAYSA